MSGWRLILPMLALMLSCVDTTAQSSAPMQEEAGYRSEPVDVNFLFGYYEQDGNHSAVTGGIGTEELWDIDSRVIIHIPVDTITSLTFNIGINHYTSASTDNIDFDMSSASMQDNRVQLSAEYYKEQPDANRAFYLDAAGSIESDYISSSIGAGWVKTSKDKMRQFDLSARVYFDTWVVIFPEELRQPQLASVETDKRRSANLSFSLTQITSKRSNIQFLTDVIYQNGLLSTPFHRVYFTDGGLSIEQLPNSRIKVPFAFRFNYFVADPLILRVYYRFYWDNFGILAHTANLELPIKLSSQFTLYPFYRLHFQTKSTYFRPYGQHLPDSEYHTSDFDLSGFFSHKVGGGFQYKPIPHTSGKQPSSSHFRLSNAGFRYSNYWRTDGLKAYQITVNVGMQF